LQQGGPVLNFETLDKLGLGDVRLRLFELIKKSRELKLDYNEYMCLKFLILLNSGQSQFLIKLI
jgi:nuclear receptor subfamily 5 group A protein 2